MYPVGKNCPRLRITPDKIIKIANNTPYVTGSREKHGHATKTNGLSQQNQ